MLPPRKARRDDPRPPAEQQAGTCVPERPPRPHRPRPWTTWTHWTQQSVPSGTTSNITGRHGYRSVADSSLATTSDSSDGCAGRCYGPVAARIARRGAAATLGTTAYSGRCPSRWSSSPRTTPIALAVSGVACWTPSYCPDPAKPAPGGRSRLTAFASGSMSAGQVLATPLPSPTSRSTTWQRR
jgi:hypothetical protein